MKKIINIILLLSVILSSCESMTDTYDEYLEGGLDRNLGITYDVKLERGWERFKLSWKNSLDPDIDKIKIVWTDNLVSDSVVLDSDATEFMTAKTFEDKSYTFDIYTLNNIGETSKRVSLYGRPYSLTHEEVVGFSALERKSYFVGNNLVLILSDYNADLADTKIEYYQAGAKVERELTKEDFEAKYLVIKDIDADDVKMYRTGKIETCFDPILFDPYVLDRNTKALPTDLTNLLKSYYFVEAIDADLINNLETLYIDYPISSVEDLLVFPNLKKVVFGAHRYWPWGSSTAWDEKIKEMDNSIFALETAVDLLGIEVETHSYLFGIDEWTYSFVTGLNGNEPPSITPLDNTGWEVTSPTSEEGHDAHLENLLDNDSYTDWTPLPIEGSMREHVIVIDMKAVKDIDGFLVRQSQDWSNSEYHQSAIHIMVSDDNKTWNEVSPLNNMMGNGSGEITIINPPVSVSARYVKLTLNDVLANRRNVVLADFIIY